MTTTDGPKPRPEWELLPVFDRRYSCRWCPFWAPVPSMKDDHEKTCKARPMTEENPDGCE